MADPPSPFLTDRAALLRQRARALLQGPVDFLHREVAREVKERLAEVNRSFTKPVIVTGHADFWGDAFPGVPVVPDDDALVLVPGAHDLVIHALALHWANDPVGQLIQCRRALCPDGLFLGVLFGGRTLSELRSALAEAEAALTGGLSPRVLPMGEIRDLGGLLGRAGLALPVADAGPLTVTYPSVQALMHDLRAMGEGNALSARRRATTPRRLFTETERRYRAAFGRADGTLPATFETIWLTGWAPGPDQQQPLRPGSALARLGDALGAAEVSLPDWAGGPKTD
jgi:SAM-dependent methyltransferase